jgi:hypothetical protein
LVDLNIEGSQLGQVIQLYTARDWDADERACLQHLRAKSLERHTDPNVESLFIEEGQTDEGDP